MSAAIHALTCFGIFVFVVFFGAAIRGILFGYSPDADTPFESDHDRVIRETLEDEGVWWSDYNT